MARQGSFRVERVKEVGVPTVGNPTQQAARQRIGPDPLELVPTDVGNEHPTPEAAHPSGQQAEPGNARRFIAVGKEHLEAHTNPSSQAPVSTA